MLSWIRSFWRNNIKSWVEKWKHLKKVKAWINGLPEFTFSEPLPKHLLIVRTDDIGDYILFRPAFEAIRNSNRFSDWKITVIGNGVWKDLAVNMDDRNVDQWIWLDKKSWFNDVDYRNSFLLKIRDLSPSCIWIPARTRHFFLEDTISLAFPGIRKITSGNDFSSYPTGLEQQVLQRLNYTVLSPKDKAVHEWAFNSEVCGLMIADSDSARESFEKPLINKLKSALQKPFPNYIVLFPGASAGSKRWPPHHFAQFVKQIRGKSGIPILIAGSEGDSVFANEIIKLGGTQNEGSLLNYCGKTTLIELMDLIRMSDFLISNDTSAAHMAASMGVSVFALANGNKFGRFFPYSPEFKNVSAFYPAKTIPFNFKGRYEMNQIKPSDIAQAYFNLVQGKVENHLK